MYLAQSNTLVQKPTATFYMMKTDGTAPHKHDIYDLQDVPTSVALMGDSAVGRVA
jgi:hypothetical protein